MNLVPHIVRPLATCWLVILALAPSQARAGTVEIRVTSRTPCSMNCIQIATVNGSANGPWSPAVCSRTEPLPRGASCRVTTSTSGTANLQLDPSSCTVLRMRMFTIGQGLPLPSNLNQPLSDWVTFHTDRVPAAFPGGDNTMFSVDPGSDAGLAGISLWINDNYLHDDDFLDAYVELTASAPIAVENINSEQCH